MKSFIVAIFFSLIIHFILLINIKVPKPHIQTSNNKNISQYTYISLANIKQPKEQIKKQKDSQEITKIVNKNIIKKEKQIRKPYIKVVKKDIKPIVRPKKIKELPIIKRESPKEIIKKHIPVKITLRQKPMVNLDKEYQELEMLDSLTQNYIKLYGEEYFKFSKQQKKYLKDNLNLIGRITQQYLYYPSIAIKTKQQGTSIIEFILKTNGDITNLQITNSSGYNSLDKNTIKTIKIAYKDYPTPKEDTKVKIFVSYILN